MALLKLSALVLHAGSAGNAYRPYSKTCPPPLPPPTPEQEATAKVVADALEWQRRCQANPFAFGCVGISSAGGGGGGGGDNSCLHTEFGIATGPGGVPWAVRTGCGRVAYLYPVQ